MDQITTSTDEGSDSDEFLKEIFAEGFEEESDDELAWEQTWELHDNDDDKLYGSHHDTGEAYNVIESRVR